MDELAHIPAGYGYVSQLDHRLNPEHPPLVKALAGLPLLFGNFRFPVEHSAWQKDVNGQWEMGNQFFYHAGNDADRLIQTARYGPIALTLLLIIFIYMWSAELLGRWWAIVPTLLFGLSPNVLAHGHYVTTDVAAAFGVVFATYYFIKLLHKPSPGAVVRAGLAFGVAQIGKFSAVLLLPYFAFLAFFYVLAVAIRSGAEAGFVNTLRIFFLHGVRVTIRTLVVIVVGYVLVVYPLYAIFTSGYPIERQVADTSFILKSFAGGETMQGVTCKPARCLADLNIWMSGNPIFRPFAEYMLGVLMVLQRSAGGNTNYFLGEVSAAGWHYYFPVVYSIKEPLPVVMLVSTALLLSFIAILKRIKNQKAKTLRYFADYLGLSFTEFAMISFIIFYWAYSIQSPLYIGFRHLFPTLPFIYILTTSFWKRFITTIRIESRPSIVSTLWSGFRTVLRTSMKYIVFLALILWAVFETVRATPYYLSYFNELGGGTERGYRYVTDSNYDWGQDLLRLKHFVEAHPEIDRIGVDYFGGGNPKYYLGAKEENWWSARGNPADQQIHWLAVSVNTLQGATQKPVPGFERKPEDEYRWLTNSRPPAAGMGNVPEPNYRVGTSIFVYKLY